MKTPRQKLKNKLDVVFSQYIRRRYADFSGRSECFTCGKVDHWKKMDAGHFMGRVKMSTRWDEANVQVQCKRCNIFLHGNQYKFGLQLDRKYGEGKADELQFLSAQMVKFDETALQEEIDNYSELLAELPE